MPLRKFKDLAGQAIWVNEDHVSAVGTIFSDGSATGESAEARPITFVLLISGETLHVDHSAEAVSLSLSPA